MNTIENENKYNSKEYAKQYYLDHKDKIKEQIKTAQNRQKLCKFIIKLNSSPDAFKRMPYSRIIKYKVLFDSEKKIYFI